MTVHQMFRYPRYHDGFVIARFLKDLRRRLVAPRSFPNRFSALELDGEVIYQTTSGMQRRDGWTRLTR